MAANGVRTARTYDVRNDRQADRRFVQRRNGTVREGGRSESAFALIRIRYEVFEYANRRRLGMKRRRSFRIGRLRMNVRKPPAGNYENLTYASHSIQLN